MLFFNSRDGSSILCSLPHPTTSHALSFLLFPIIVSFLLSLLLLTVLLRFVFHVCSLFFVLFLIDVKGSFSIVREKKVDCYLQKSCYIYSKKNGNLKNCIVDDVHILPSVKIKFITVQSFVKISSLTAKIYGFAPPPARARHARTCARTHTHTFRLESTPFGAIG